MKPSLGMDLKQLHYFLAVCDAGSISAAAVRLGVGQATLSESLARQERRFGTALLVRGSRGVLLTQAGEVLAREGRALLSAADKLAAAVTLCGESRGDVALGLPPSLSILAGVPLAETIHSEAPRIRLRVSEGLSGDVLDWLRDGRLDLGFAFEMPNLTVFDAAPVFREELFLLAAADFLPGAAGDMATPVTLDALHGLPVVLPSLRHNTRRLISRILRPTGIVPEFVAEVDSYSQILEMLLRASACTILPRAAFLGPIAAGTLVAVPIAGAPFQRTCCCIRRRDRPVSTASLHVQQAVSDILREMSARHALAFEFPAGPGAPR